MTREVERLEQQLEEIETKRKQLILTR